MRILDSRRLTGINVDHDAPGAIAEVAFDPGDDIPRLLARWRAAVLAAAAALGWQTALAVRRYSGDHGAALSFTAPLDALYLAADINDWALARAAESPVATGTPPSPGAASPVPAGTSASPAAAGTPVPTDRPAPLDAGAAPPVPAGTSAHPVPADRPAPLGAGASAPLAPPGTSASPAATGTPVPTDSPAPLDTETAAPPVPADRPVPLDAGAAAPPALADDAASLAADLAAVLPAWQAARAREAVAGLAALQAGAHARDLPLLLDDDHLSIGVGRGSRTWPRASPPAPEGVPWDSLHAAPIALITGTNGKTTTARLLAHIARMMGHVPGNTSTDGLEIDGVTALPGDWTGPGAARTVLRDPRVTLAVLEVARGGILRRGLGVDRCDAACITNVAPDHLGEYGIDDLATMARVKAVVARAVHPRGRIVLGADSPPLLALPTDSFRAPVTWFSLDPDHPRLREHRAAGGDVYFCSRSGHLTRGRGHADDEALVPVADLPICFGGAATHNVANALAAAALAGALGLPDAAVVAGLRGFTDNPGRAHHLHLGGVQLFLDFAHNPDGIAAVSPLLVHLRGDRRLLISIGVAGDRRDDDIRAVARAVAALRPDRVLTRDLEHYLRGRAPGEVPALLEASLHDRGIPCERAADEVDALRRALAWAEPGDLVAILVHVDREEVWAELRARGVDPPASSARRDR